MAQQATSHKSIEETTIFDADVHLTIPPESLVPYLDEPFDKRISESVFDHPFPSSGWHPYMGGKIEDYITDFNDAEAVREYCSEFHVDHPILNTFEPLSRMPEKSFAENLMYAYNDLLLEQFLDKDDEFYGVASLATQTPEKTAEEIDRLADEDQIIGGYIGSTAAHPPLGDPEYDIMYRAAEENDFTIAYHGSVADLMIGFPRQYQGFDKMIQGHTVAHLWSQTETVMSLVMNGVPEKFPDLNFAILESGISWVPHLMWRMNEEHGIRRSEAPLLKKTPEEYVRDSFYFATQPLGEPNNPSHWGPMFDIIGAENIMFASDYPHWDFDSAGSTDDLFKQHFSPEEREQIFSGTPEEAFPRV